MRKSISIQKVDPRLVLGVQDRNLLILQDNFSASIVVRGTEVIINGSDTEINIIERVLGEMMLTISRNRMM